MVCWLPYMTVPGFIWVLGRVGHNGGGMGWFRGVEVTLVPLFVIGSFKSGLFR